ncbi:hypothetical protein D3C81_1233070 [compost metagenome]
MIEQEAGVGQPRVIGARIEGQRGLEGGARALGIAGGHQFAGLVQRLLARVRGQAVQEFTQARLRQYADELVHGLPIGNRHHMGNAAHAEMRGQLLVLVHIDLGELPLAAGFGFELFQHRSQRAAWATPGRPEIDQHGHLPRHLDHVGFEILQGDVAHVLPFGMMGAGMRPDLPIVRAKPRKATFGRPRPGKPPLENRTVVQLYWPSVDETKKPVAKTQETR